MSSGTRPFASRKRKGSPSLEDRVLAKVAKHSMGQDAIQAIGRSVKDKVHRPPLAPPTVVKHQNQMLHLRVFLNRRAPGSADNYLKLNAQPLTTGE